MSKEKKNHKIWPLKVSSNLKFGNLVKNISSCINNNYIDVFETRNRKIFNHPYEFPKAVCKAKMIAK